MGRFLKEPALVFDFKSASTLESRHHISSWDGFKIEYSSFPLPTEYAFSGANPDMHYLAYHDLVVMDGELEIDGLPPISRKDLRDTMTYIPCKRRFKGWAAPEARINSFITLTYKPDLLEKELEIPRLGHETDPRVYFRHENLRSIMLRMVNLFKSQNLNPSLHLEGLGLMALIETAMLLDTPEKAALRRGRLGQSQIKQVEEYIRANLTKDMSLDELASVVQMSRFHFSRSFKESFGCSPIRYINRERFNFAQALLSNSRLPVGEIAHQTGFGSVQHFIKIFKDFSGITPTEYRNQS